MTKQPREISVLLSSFYGIFMWTAAVIVTTVLVVGNILLIMPLAFLFGERKGKWSHTVAVLWGKILLGCAPFWRIRVTGLENVVPGKHYIVVANHQSMLDIIIVLSRLPVQFKFLAKKELFSIPFLGWHMRAAGYIPIERSSHESGRRAVDICREWIEKGVSVLFFPEGTRSVDGQIKDFKSGAFKIAAETKTDILPVIIDGAWNALPKKSWRIRRYSEFRFDIGKPIAVPGAAAGPEELKKSARDQMIRKLSDLRLQSRE